MSFRKYLAESEKSYSYRLKTVIEIDDDFMNKVEQFLTRYKLLDITRPSKTIMQPRPLDFPGLTNREVFMFDFKTSFPLSTFNVSQEFTNMFNIPGGYLIVRGTNDPVEIDSKTQAEVAEVEAKAEKSNLEAQPLLTTDPVSPENEFSVDGSNYYGDAYNGRLMKALKEIEDERKDSQKVDAPASLFKWLDMPKADVDAGDFNKDIEQSETPAADKDAKQVTSTGNFDSTDNLFKKNYLNARTGKVKTLAPKAKK